MTVLFADLSGYTAFAERMDPEDVKSLVDRALLRLGEEVQRYGGTVDKYIGDNVMAIFGAPVAHEDDAERAVRAGLGHAGRHDRGERGPALRGALRAAGGREHGRGDRGRGGRGLHRRRRHRERGLAASVRGPSRQRHGRRADDARDRRGGRLHGPRAARAEGEGRARARLGGGRADRRALRAAGGAGLGVAARGPRAGARRARQPVRARGARGHLAPGDRRGRGRSGQVAASARVRAAAGVTSLDAHGPDRPLPAVRERNRVLGARRGAARRVRDRGVRLVRAGVAEAPRLRGRPGRRRGHRLLGPRGRADRPPARRGRAVRAGAGGGRPRADARGLPGGPPARHRADRPARPVRDRVRGHPLGGRRHARRDRAPRAVGARAADARVPGARRAARPAGRAGAAGGGPRRS